MRVCVLNANDHYDYYVCTYVCMMQMKLIIKEKLFKGIDIQYMHAYILYTYMPIHLRM